MSNIKLSTIITEMLLEGIPELESKRIHLSRNEIKKIDDPIWDTKGRISSKPVTGLFYAMGDVWVDYLSTYPEELYSRKHIYEVVLKPSARILAPKTQQEYINITFKYPSKGWSFKGEFTPSNFVGNNIGSLVPDYEKMSKDYDGIEIFDVGGKSPTEISYTEEYPINWPDEYHPPHGVVWNNNVATLVPINLNSQHFDTAVAKKEKLKKEHPEWFGDAN